MLDDGQETQERIMTTDTVDQAFETLSDAMVASLDTVLSVFQQQGLRPELFAIACIGYGADLMQQHAGTDEAVNQLTDALHGIQATDSTVVGEC